jgi:hypothetical protein
VDPCSHAAIFRAGAHDITLADLADTHLRTYRSDFFFALPKMSDLAQQPSTSITANSAASQPETKGTFNLSKSSAFALLLETLKIFKEVAGKTPVPGLQEGVKALVVVLDVVQVRPLSNMQITRLLICHLRKHRRTSTKWNRLLSASKSSRQRWRRLSVMMHRSRMPCAIASNAFPSKSCRP